MNIEDYKDEVICVKTICKEKCLKQLNKDHVLKMLYVAMGLSQEVGQLQRLIKKTIFSNKKFEAAQIVEELGDIMRYMTVAMDTMGIRLEDIMDINIHKLRQRRIESTRDNIDQTYLPFEK